MLMRSELRVTRFGPTARISSAAGSCRARSSQINTGPVIGFKATKCRGAKVNVPFDSRQFHG
jgi:hypothetical protein